MREIVEIYGNQDTQDDGAGGIVATISLLLKTYANVRYLNSSRNAESNQAELNQVIEVIVWRRLDFEPKVGQWVKWRELEYSITGVVSTNNAPRREIITAKARQ